MTIEAKIEELTAAVNKLVDVFAKYAAPVFTPPPTEYTLEQIARKLDAPKLDEPKKEKSKTKGEPKKEKPEAVTETAPVVEYAQVRDKVLELIKADPNNRAKVLEALEPFGVDTAKALKPEQYAEALEALNGIEA